MIHYQGDHAKKYIEHYSNNKLLTKNDPLVKAYYIHIIPLLKTLKAGKYRELSERIVLISQLEEIIADMEQSLLKNALKELQDVLHCAEPLAGHDHFQVIDHSVCIFIAELSFKGYPKKDLMKLVERVLSNEIKLVKNKTYTKFPLPKEFFDTDLVETPVLNERIERFMSNRTLREQFDGIFNFYQNSADNKILFKVLNTKSKKRVDKTYDNIRIITNVKSYLSADMNEKYREFLISKDAIFIEASVSAASVEGAELLAVEMINRALPKFDIFFNVRLVVDLGITVARINGHFTMRTKFSSEWIRNVNPIKTLTEKKLQRIDNSASRRFLHLESLYAEATTGKLPDIKLNNYWRYLESSLSGMGMGARQIRHIIAQIMCNYHAGHLWFNYCQLASEVLDVHRMNFDNGDIKLTYREIVDFLGLEQLNPQWVVQANKYIEHPFLTRRFGGFSSKTVEQIQLDLLKFYNEILIEAYEQRNFIQHTGIYQQMAVSKLLFPISDIVDKIRYLILSNILKKKYDSYQQIIEHLKITPPKMVKLIKRKALITELC